MNCDNLEQFEKGLEKQNNNPDIDPIGLIITEIPTS